MGGVAAGAAITLPALMTLKSPTPQLKLKSPKLVLKLASSRPPALEKKKVLQKISTSTIL